MNEQRTKMPVKIDNRSLAQICTSQRWQGLVLHAISAQGKQAMNRELLLEIADKAFCQLNESDWLEAFAGHPMIGDLDSLARKYSQGKQLSKHEQHQVNHASKPVLQDLLTLNQAYLDQFGFIFIVCASHKSAEQMLALLKERIDNSRAQELLNASVEQRKISQLRIEALI